MSGERAALIEVLRPVIDRIERVGLGNEIPGAPGWCYEYTYALADVLLAAGWRGPEIVAQLRDMEIERNILRETLREVLANHPEARSEAAPRSAEDAESDHGCHRDDESAGEAES
jgi:hypothetical protein